MFLTRNFRTKFCINVSNRNITVYHINFVLSGLEWRVCLSSFNIIHKQSPGGVQYKKVFLKISLNSQKNNFVRVSFPVHFQVSGLQHYKEETRTQVFSWEFSKIFKNTFFKEQFRWLPLKIVSSLFAWSLWGL